MDCQIYNTSNKVLTKLGTVKVIPLSQQPPVGWRNLQFQEGKTIINDLKKILTTWSIVALGNGKIDGSGYNYGVHQSYGEQCGEKFVISQTNDQYLQPGLVQQIPQQCYHQKEFDQPIQYYSDYNQYQQGCQNINQAAPFSSQIVTNLGIVKVVPLSQQPPVGWRNLQFQEGKTIINDLKKILTTWSIVALGNGKIDGSGYNYGVHQSYGEQCGEKFIVNSD